MVRKKATVKRTGTKTTQKAVNTSAARTEKKAVRKTSVKRSPIQEYEQTIAKARVALGKAHIKAVVQCQKPVDKLQTQLNRVLLKQQSLRGKKEAATQQAAEQGTQGAKKQAARAREALQVVNEKIKGIRADLKAAKQALNSARSAQKKFAASEKQLEKFEQDWIKASRPRRKIMRRTRNTAATQTKEKITAQTVKETGVVPAESENPTQEVSAET